MSNNKNRGEAQSSQAAKKPGVTIEDKREAFTIDVKRFYMPVTIKATCPECGEETTKSLQDEYLSYPNANEVQTLLMYCLRDHSFNVKAKLVVALEVVS